LAALFVSAATGNYHLLSTSPAIDKALASQAAVLDLEANFRPVGAGYDIGAYEYGASATPPSVPTAPSGASATAPSYNKVTLTWVDNSTNEEGFKIERCVTGGTFVEIGRVGPGITTYSDGGLSPNTQYSYRVRAWNAGGHSAFCPSANVTTATLAPGSY